jgi:hypothetical protein
MCAFMRFFSIFNRKIFTFVRLKTIVNAQSYENIVKGAISYAIVSDILSYCAYFGR